MSRLAQRARSGLKELFVTNVSVTEMRRKHVPRLGCNDKLWTITRSLSGKIDLAVG